jgi:hypothetical protein
MFGLVVAASSEPVRVWTNPELAPTEESGALDGEDPVAAPSSESAERDQPSWVGSVLHVIAIGAFASALLLGAYASYQLMPSVRGWRRSRSKHREPFGDPLPDSRGDPVRIDADAARASLLEGPARNAIVACWIQLEDDVAAAGLPRHPAETSSEYVERVIGESSIDGAPITELATLYREARFSTHDLEFESRIRAAEALDRVVAALDHRNRVAT